MRAIADLVMNHTSDQHSWLQEARQDRNSPNERLLRLDRRSRNLFRRSHHLHQVLSFRLDIRSGRGSAVSRYSVLFDEPHLNYDNPAKSQEMFDVARFLVNGT